MHKNGNNNSSQYRNELKFRIIRTAMPLFKQKGIKAVRMDDIANILSISKRTLYEIYNNKEDLLLEGVKNDYYEMTKRIQDYAMTAENEIDIVVTFFRMKFADLDSITPKFFTELDKYEKVKLFMQEYKTEQQTEATEFIRKYLSECISYTGCWILRNSLRNHRLPV
ncbi:TetR/AcrR family transcriptional regulator [Prevotella sp.]|uniref:TetR/AcrR family transcriptional regulator n=1 Tax=Prevotella sp. TaxID=59823 RepID=UPI00307FD8DD